MATTQDTASNTTLAADDSKMDSTTTATEKIDRHSKSKHKADKKHGHKKTDASWRLAPAAPVAVNKGDAYFYDSDYAASDDAVDASADFDETVSGTTQAPVVYNDGGNSPFSQEPYSRFPIRIGSGQLTGEDKNATIFDGPGLFQDPSALGRDLNR